MEEVFTKIVPPPVKLVVHQSSPWLNYLLVNKIDTNFVRTTRINTSLSQAQESQKCHKINLASILKL